MTNPSIFHRIAALLPELAALEHSHAGPRSPRSGTPTTDTARLPFGIVIDDPDEPADATTVDGILYWAILWCSGVCAVVPDDAPKGRFTNSHGKLVAVNDDPLDYLHTRQELIQHACLFWPDLLEEAQIIYARAARRTGHGQARYGWCSCGGSVWQEYTEDGLSDWMVCDGPAEHWFRDAAHYADVQRGMARAVTQVGRYWVTRRAVRTIWPWLKPNTLTQWVKRGHVTASAGRYDLAQINKRMARDNTATAA